MADKGGTGRLLSALILAFAPPAVAAGIEPKFVARHPLATIAILVIYGSLVVAGGFLAKTWRIVEAEWTKQLATAVTSVTSWRIGYGRSYQQRVRINHGNLDEKGLPYRGENQIAIEEVFVDVGLMPRPPGQISSAVVVTTDRADQSPDLRRRSIWDFLKDQKSPVTLTIIGAPGSGKTTLLRHVSWRLARKGRRDGKRRRSIPVLLVLGDCFAKILAEPQLSLATLIEAQVESGARRPPDGWFEKRLASGHCVVMFDGVDEIADQSHRQTVLQWIQQQTTRYASNDYLVTSRPPGQRDDSLQLGTMLHVLEFTPAQVENFVRRWHRSAERDPHVKAGRKDDVTTSAAAEKLLERIERTALFQLAPNPLLLTMICRVNRHRGELPTTRPELYRVFCDVLLEKRQRGKQLLKTGEAASVLSELAFARMAGSSENALSTEAAKIIKDPLKRINSKVTPEAFLANVCDTGLLIESEHGDYDFVHQTFREYLAATAISGYRQLRTLLGKVADPAWREVSLFYAAISGADQIVKACLESGKLPALALAFDCADADSSLDGGLRGRLKLLLDEATDPSAPAERRRLAAAVIATRELRPVIRLSSDVRICGAPVSGQLFGVFVAQSKGEFPSRGIATDSDAAAGVPAVGVQASQVLAFLGWLDELSGGRRLFRLPTRAEAEDAKFPSKNYGVWLASPGDPQELDLWVPPGVEHPYIVSDGQLRQRAEADSTGFASKTLTIVLALALVHTLAAEDTLWIIRQQQHRPLAVEARRSLNKASQLAQQMINRLAPDDDDLNRALNGALTSVKSSAMPRMFAHDLVNLIETSMAITQDRASDLAIELTRFRASDLEGSIRVLVSHIPSRERHQSAVTITRPTGKSRDLNAKCGRILAGALDRAFDQALSWARQSEMDLDLPMSLQFARRIPVEGQQRKALDAIWSPALEVLVKQRPDRIIMPGSLARISAEALDELPAITADFSNGPQEGRLIAVAEKVQYLVAAITSPSATVIPEEISYIRLGAISLAANLTPDPSRHALASKYLDIASGVTAIERQFLGQELPQETIILAQA